MVAIFLTTKTRMNINPIFSSFVAVENIDLKNKDEVVSWSKEEISFDDTQNYKSTGTSHLNRDEPILKELVDGGKQSAMELLLPNPEVPLSLNKKAPADNKTAAISNTVQSIKKNVPEIKGIKTINFYLRN